MKTTLKNILLTLLFLPLFVGCLDDDHIPIQVNETEEITEVELVFNDSDGIVKSYKYVDPLYRLSDYEDPEILLETGKTYQVSVLFWNKSNPDEIEEVTEEVIEEKDEHFLEFRFYEADILLTRTDTEETTDEAGIPIGIFTQWIPQQSTNDGTVQVTLIHQPETKSIENPQGNHTGGETDAEVIFGLRIE